MNYQDSFEEPVNITKTDDVTVIQIANADQKCRSGTMEMNELLPGITLVFNDFSMKEIKSSFHPKSELFCVDYCRKGRIEQEVKPGFFRYVGPKDIRIDNRKNHATKFYFPLEEYQGITVMFDIQIADASIKSIMPDFPVTILKLQEKYCETEPYAFLRNEGYIEHIFEEIYGASKEIKRHYMIVKVLELLLCLWELDSEIKTEAISYYTKNQTDKVKAICEEITKNLQRNDTLEELSSRFNISPTSMKSTFKGIYGKPIHLWLTQKRMEHAAKLLKETDKSVTEIANEVGYESPSKFSAAFKRIMNLTPMEFRNHKE